MLTQLILAIGFAVVVSALCSIFEAVLYSVPLSRVELLAQKRPYVGNILKKLKQDIHRPITAILTLNTIANTAGAAVAGAAAAVVFGEQHLTLFFAAFTVSILLFSEIIPKTLGVSYSKLLAPWIALPLHWLVKIMAPAVWVIHLITRRLGSSQNEEVLVSAKEVAAFAAISQQTGAIDNQEASVITNILELRHQRVRDAMTPRTVTFILDAELTVGEAREFEKKWNFHSRVPVYTGEADNIVGIVLRKDVLLAAAADNHLVKLKDLMQPVHFVPESARLTRILLDFFELRRHLFVVVDEYGGFTGVISLEDVIEEIVGREIIDESDQIKDMRELAKNKRELFLKQLNNLK
ncbi:hemolysin family protein [Desulfurivibrio dismutans]|uniref:hemolysin family protein n=1 Tax=Desulfurivibrio dismutans TaxID=1398908 RepID=UPI0023DC264D|nr:hemolysin family protein [Desulfurivibrio alkaliphilus]MDF1615259.1 hemolysin family protein [Desulfurivibrio alkaliphilus]